VFRKLRLWHGRRALRKLAVKKAALQRRYAQLMIEIAGGQANVTPENVVSLLRVCALLTDAFVVYVAAGTDTARAVAYAASKVLEDSSLLVIPATDGVTLALFTSSADEIPGHVFELNMRIAREDEYIRVGTAGMEVR